MVTKSFQKSANNLPMLHPGIIDSEGFNKYFQLNCYEPSADLTPFVVHIWTQRRQQPFNSTNQPIEILSGPNFYLFFTLETAFVHSITTQEFKYNALEPGVIAGVKFRPGGFYPFLQRPVSDLSVTTPVESLFPEVTKTFRKNLLSQPDEAIVATLEALLQNKRPQSSKNLGLITQILEKLDNDTTLKTVEAVAQTFNTSERSLQLLFQTHVGIGLKWIITRKRLLETISQIQSQRRPSLAEVTAEVGYSSQSHFTREFKKVIGQSPSQYLKSIKALTISTYEQQ